MSETLQDTEVCESCGGLIEGSTPFSKYCDACIHTCRVCDAQFINTDYKHECPKCEAEITEATLKVLDRLEWQNAHTTAALLNWETFGKMPNGATDYKMIKGYKAAQLEIFGTQ